MEKTFEDFIKEVEDYLGYVLPYCDTEFFRYYYEEKLDAELAGNDYEYELNELEYDGQPDWQQEWEDFGEVYSDERDDF